MGNFNRGGKSSGGHNFGKRNFGGNRNMGRPQLHNAVCSNCGKECQVPFKPTGDKPVYCRDCFAKMNGEDSRKNIGRNDRNERQAFRRLEQDTRSQSMGDQQLKAINVKLDKILALLTPAAEVVQEEAPAEVEVQVAPQNEEVHIATNKKSPKKAKIPSID